MKRFLLALSLIISPSIMAHVIPYEHDELLAKLYLQVDMSECPRIVMQQIGLTYIDWLDDMNGEIETQQDAVYMARLAHMYGEVFLSYQYGNK